MISPAVVVGVGVAAVALEQAQEEVLPLGFLDPDGWFDFISLRGSILKIAL